MILDMIYSVQHIKNLFRKIERFYVIFMTLDLLISINIPYIIYQTIIGERLYSSFKLQQRHSLFYKIDYTQCLRSKTQKYIESYVLRQSEIYLLFFIFQ